MLVHPWDAPNHDDEWRAVLQDFGFGQLIAPGGPDRELPVVVPTHFTFDGGRTVELHLAKPNPVWRALADRPRALLTVVTDYVYVSAAINADPGQDPALAVPTSYYAAVHVEVDVQIIDDPAAKAAILTRALNHFEPANSPRVTRGVAGESDRLQLENIRGCALPSPASMPSSSSAATRPCSTAGRSQPRSSLETARWMRAPANAC